MKDISQVPSAVIELLDDSDSSDPSDDSLSAKVELARRLESQGKKPICVGRALVTVERCECDKELPEGLRPNWGVMKLSIYPDPDVTGAEDPVALYIDGGRFGLDKLVYECSSYAKTLET